MSKELLCFIWKQVGKKVKFYITKAHVAYKIFYGYVNIE